MNDGKIVYHGGRGCGKTAAVRAAIRANNIKYHVCPPDAAFCTVATTEYTEKERCEICGKCWERYDKRKINAKGECVQHYDGICCEINIATWLDEEARDDE